MSDQRSDRCETCAYFHRLEDWCGECRRYAPRPYNFLRFSELELIRDIAWSLRQIAHIAPPESKYDVLRQEATELTQLRAWPEVEPADWCGEWKGRA